MNDIPRGDLLEAIVAAARRIVETREQHEPLEALRARALAVLRTPGRFRNAIAERNRVNVIAECKRRSPSRGVLRADYEPAAIAGAYAAGGAAAVSVLTEPTFFDGSLAHLEAVRAAIELPILRKDFIVSEYQLLEARAAGADAVLLIVAALSRGELESLARGAAALALDALVEVHDDRELDVALEAGAEIVGVNNRNLRTLEVDLDASERLAALIPDDVVAISESGLTAPADLARFASLGYRAFLVGERFMTASDPGAALRSLIAAAAAAPKSPAVAR